MQMMRRELAVAAIYLLAVPLWTPARAQRSSPTGETATGLLRRAIETCCSVSLTLVGRRRMVRITVVTDRRHQPAISPE
jgi:hypothetical protein